MKKFITLVVGFFLVLCGITVACGLLLPAYVPAEYWARPLIIEKEAIAASKVAPRIIIAGGSSTLFGIDARKIERETGVPTVNFGLTGAIRLERLLQLINQVIQPGDLVVMSLEPNFYRCDELDWTPWAFRNSIAWDRTAFKALPMSEQIRAGVTAATPALLFDQIYGLLKYALGKDNNELRRKALASKEEILELWQSRHPNPTFEYSQLNLDDNGDMLFTDGSHPGLTGATGTEIASICPEIRKRLSLFDAELKAHGARVVFASPPYMINNDPDPAWKSAEASFRQDMENSNLTLLDERSDVFFKPEDFYNLLWHLNSNGREKRTAQLIRDLTKAHMIPVISDKNSQ